MLNIAWLQYEVVQPTLHYLNDDTPFNKLLLLAWLTAVYYNPSGAPRSCIGPFQLSTDQHRMIWDQHLAKQPDLASRVRGLASQHRFLENPDAELSTNLAYATAIAWMLLQVSLTQMNPRSIMADSLTQYWDSYMTEQTGISAQQFRFALEWIEQHAHDEAA